MILHVPAVLRLRVNPIYSLVLVKGLLLLWPNCELLACNLVSRVPSTLSVWKVARQKDETFSLLWASEAKSVFKAALLLSDCQAVLFQSHFSITRTTPPENVIFWCILHDEAIMVFSANYLFLIHPYSNQLTYLNLYLLPFFTMHRIFFGLTGIFIIRVSYSNNLYNSIQFLHQQLPPTGSLWLDNLLGDVSVKV